MSEVDILAVERGPVRELRLHHPARRNALTDALLGRLVEELDRAEADGIRCLLLRGEGALAFSAGYDLNALPAPTRRGKLPDALLESALARLEDAPMPVVALLNGPAFGGGLELAARCDLRIAVAGIKLGMPPARLGIVYAPRGLARFWALMGPGAARKLFLAAEPLSAEQALAAGLVDEVCPTAEAAEARARALAEAIAANAPLAVSGMRRLFGELERSLLQGVDAPAAVRTRRQAFASEDAREGLAAFLGKRPPRFSGR